MTGLRAGAVSVLLFFVAFAIRCIPAPRVFASEGVHLFGTDAYYHLRRVLFTLERFPETLTFDRYINYPHGGQPIWPPLFDFVLALVALPVHAGSDPENAVRIERLLVWVPPLLGAGTVAVLVAMARRVFDPTVATAAGAILAVLSGHYWYSQIGFIDHHAAVAFLGAVLLAVAARWLTTWHEPGAWRWAATIGLVVAAILLVWPGALLHVLVLEASLLAFVATRESRSEARGAAVASFVANGVGFAAIAPWSLGREWASWSDFSPAVATSFQPWLLGALAAHAAACAGAWRGDWGRTRRVRVLEAGGIGLAVLALSVSFFPALLEGALEAWRWLFKEEAFQAVVAESKPLFFEPGGFDATVAEARLSRFVYLLPFVVAGMALITRNAERRHAIRLLVLQTAVLAAVTLLQRRFFNSLSVMVALTMAWALVEAYRRTPSRSRPIAAIGVAALSLWLLLPVFQSYRLPLRNVFEALRSERLTLPEATVRQRRFAEAAVWLRENSPPTSGFLDPDVQPEYGVLAPWSQGHVIEYRGRRPTVADNFGDDLGGVNFLASYRYFDAPADEAADLVRQLGVRYVLMRTFVRAGREALPKTSMRYLLSGPREELDGLPGLRLVYDRPMQLAQDRGRIRIFEVR